jgi:hypothetical protein
MARTGGFGTIAEVALNRRACSKSSSGSRGGTTHDWTSSVVVRNLHNPLRNAKGRFPSYDVTGVCDGHLTLRFTIEKISYRWLAPSDPRRPNHQQQEHTGIPVKMISISGLFATASISETLSILLPGCRVGVRAQLRRVLRDDDEFLH